MIGGEFFELQQLSSNKRIKDYFIKENQWSDNMKNIEAKIKEIALKLV